MVYTNENSKISILPYKGIYPKIHPSVVIFDGVRIAGDVEIDEDCSIWFNVVIRGDVHYVKIGKRSNIQDLAMLHVTNGKYPLNIGNNVSIGHSASVHGATLHDDCLIGIGASVLDGSVVNKCALVAAGTVVKENFVVPEATLVAGVPGKIIRDLTEQEIKRVTDTSPNYVKYSREYIECLKR